MKCFVRRLGADKQVRKQAQLEVRQGSTVQRCEKRLNGKEREILSSPSREP